MSHHFLSDAACCLERKDLSSARGERPPLLTSAAATGPQGLTRTHVLERPPVAAPQPPQRAARLQTTLPAAEETRDAESFRVRRFAKGRGRVREPGCEGVAGGAAPRLAANARGPGPDGPPRLQVIPQQGSGPLDPEGIGHLPVPGPYREAREGSLGPCQNRTTTSPRPPSYQRVPGVVGLALFICLIGEMHRLPLAHSDPQ